MIRLSIHEQGSPDARLVTFEQDWVTIGRSPNHPLCLTGRGVSGDHCRITHRGGAYTIEDLGSTNGTYVNGRKLTGPAAITGRDEIVLAIYRLRVIEAAAATTGLPASSHSPVSTSAPSGSGVPISPPLPPSVPPRAHQVRPATAPILPRSGAASAEPVPGGIAATGVPSTDPRAAGPQLTENEIAWRREWDQIEQLSRAWLAAGKDRKHLLRGAKLRHARAWLVRGRGRSPAPKPEHRDFISAASRASQVRIASSVLLALLVIGGVGVGAARVLQNEGEASSTETPEMESGVVERDPTAPATPVDSEIFAAADAAARAARELLEQEPRLAALVALEALRRLPSGGAEVRGSKAERVLREAIGKLAGQPLEGHEGPVYAVALSPDGRWAVTGSGDRSHGTARLWDLSRPGAVTPLILRGHTRPVREIAVSPDGRWVFTAGEDASLFRWDLKDADPPSTGLVLRGHDAAITSMRMSADGRWLVTGSANGQVRRWDLSGSPPSSVVLPGHEQAIHAVAVSGDGSLVVAGSDDAEGSLWSVSESGGARRIRLSGHTAAVLDVALAPDLSWILTGSADGTARLWNPKSRAPALNSPVLVGHEGPVTTVAISADAQLGLTAGEDDKILVWEIASDHPDQGSTEFNLHQGDITAILTIGPTVPKGKAGRVGTSMAVSASQDVSARTWNLDRKDHEQDSVALTGHGGPVIAVGVSSDGQWVITGSEDRTARVWDHRAQGLGGPSHPALGHTAQVLAVALVPGGVRGISAAADGTARLWDLSQPSHLRTVSVLGAHTGRVKTVAVSPDGRFAATAGEDRVVRLWDLMAVDPGASHLELQGHKGEVNRVVFGGNGKILVSVSSDRTARLWRMTREPNEDVVVLPHEDEVNSVAVSADSSLVLTGSISKLKLWDASSGDPAGKAKLLAGHESDILAVAMDPSGRWAASSSADPRVILWDLKAGPKGIKLRRHDEPVDAFAFSPDGRWLATGSRDKTIRLWDLTSAHPDEESHLLSGHTESVRQVEFSPDGRYLFSASNDATIRVWDAQAGDGEAISNTALVLSGHDQLVSDIAVASDGTFVWSGSYDTSVRLWPLDPAALVPLGCARVGRSLTPEEWERFFPSDPYLETCR